MLKKNTLFTLALLSCSTLYANIPIESRGLSNHTQGDSMPALPVTSTESALPTNLNWQLIQKTQELEKEIRILRGKIEEQDNEINQLKKELNNRYTDLDQRLELILQKTDPDYTPATTQENTTSDAQPESTATAPSNQASVAIKTSTNTAAPVPNADLEKAAYTVALDAYKQGGAQKAIIPMQNFIKNNPNSIYVSNAYFWLAEFNLALEPTNYTAAKKNFEIVIKQYPNSSKAPSALYRLYSIALNVDHNPQLAHQYKTELLKKYPNAEEVKFIQK